jgi:hypothetical protein
VRFAAGAVRKGVLTVVRNSVERQDFILSPREGIKTSAGE